MCKNGGAAQDCLSLRACVQDYVQQAIVRWVEASDETQEVSAALAESKKIISMFSSAVSTGTCASDSLHLVWAHDSALTLISSRTIAARLAGAVLCGASAAQWLGSDYMLRKAQRPDCHHASSMLKNCVPPEIRRGEPRTLLCRYDFTAGSSQEQLGNNNAQTAGPA